MRTYDITFRVLPAGVGPDDYEPADLEERTERCTFPDPGPDDTYELNGETREYGPHHAHQVSAIKATLDEGQEPLIIRTRLVD
ncbi:hypothetical protein ACFQ60_22290 [Streptomyces zhihengii]|uniref:Uncharacterized protein n=1 Tax=Streptomyces zhihengii TaxID=1818004 RepID=A0ABS2UUT0_9ACTN|nr:hypothetical protein [Streptomyces zhihengii]MBM9621043.1 hypothetical protein [Streptomyces zhihengii]